MKLMIVLAILFTSGCAIKGDLGSTGQVGTPGLGLVATTVPALASQCPSGGNVLLVAQDNLQSGVWDASDRQLTATIACNGAQGVSGANGTNATPVGIVNFCPGTTTYPSIFIETGLCIGGDIYAVYSAKGGFMTKIAPGAWSSDAIGSSCNFTVGVNCTISH